MFLETDSEFAHYNIRVMPPERVALMASHLVKELNLLRKDSLDAGLDQPNVWSKFVSWEVIQKMSDTYRPKEAQLRATISRMADAKAHPELITPLQQELSEILKDLEDAARPLNTLLIKQMGAKLQEMTGANDPQN
jgi:hypothetical protein